MSYSQFSYPGSPELLENLLSRQDAINAMLAPQNSLDILTWQGVVYIRLEVNPTSAELPHLSAPHRPFLGHWALITEGRDDEDIIVEEFDGQTPLSLEYVNPTWPFNFVLIELRYSWLQKYR